MFQLPIRQDNVILNPVKEVVGKKLSHLTLAEGEVTGHRHRITSGLAALYENNGILYLKVFSITAVLTHEEHEQITIPQGSWIVKIQREHKQEG